MQENTAITKLHQMLRAADVSHICNWQAKRDPKAKHPDVEHLSFIGNGFSPTISAAVIINYGEKNGFGFYVDVLPNHFDAMVAVIAHPRTSDVSYDFTKVGDTLRNVAKYDAELNRLEIPPNGDDYNEIMRLLSGGAYEAPKPTGR